MDTDGVSYPESGSEFVIYNAVTGEQVGPILTTDANGEATSDYLYEGSYILHQKSGISQHKRIDDITFNVSINNVEKNIEYSILNERMETKIMIRKKASKEDLDGTLTVVNESGIKFTVTAKEDIYDDDGNLVYNAGDTVTTLVTDDDGYAESAILPYGTYTVSQEMGVKDDFHTDYVEVEPFDVTFKPTDEEAIVYTVYDYARSIYVNVGKTMTDMDGKDSAEKYAVFYVLDGNNSKLKDIFAQAGYVDNENTTSASAETRMQIIADIQSKCPEAILDTLITDASGKATYKGLPTQLEDKYPNDDFMGGLLIFQAKGETGYTFAPIQHITEKTEPSSVDTETKDAVFYYDKDDNKHTAGESLDISSTTYDLTLKDKFDDYGYIKIYKDYQKSDSENAHEEGAEFTISQNGTVVDTITIGADGYGMSKKLPTGKYSIEQTKQGTAAKNHQTAFFIDDVDIRRACSSTGGLYKNPNSEEDGENITYVEYADEDKHEIVILAGNDVPFTETIGVMGNMTVVLADTAKIQTGILDKARPIYAYLYKASSSTGTLLNNAGFILSKYNPETKEYEDIIDPTDNEARVFPSGYDEDGNSDPGRVSFGALEYGKYKVREASAPTHYLLNNTDYYFELNSETEYTKKYKTECSQCGYVVPENNTSDLCPDCGKSLVDKFFYQITPTENPANDKEKIFYDEPRYGRISMTKVGDKLVGKTTSSNGGSFYWDTRPVEDATYYLYAKNNIYTYDSVVEYEVDENGNITGEKLISGTLLYAKDSLVATGTTDEKGFIQFKRAGNTSADRILPEDLTLLPLGDYYAKEVTSPDPFILDETEHPISISDNMEATQLPAGDLDGEDDFDDHGLAKYNYALVLSDNSLRFVYSSVKYKAGDIYVNGASSYTVKAAWYSDDHNTDNGSGYMLDEYTSAAEVPWASYRSQIKKVVVADEIQPDYTSYWFYNFENCTDMDLAKLDTLAVQKMSYMFCYCSGLTTLDITSFDTRNVRDMQYMFYFCTQLTTIYASDLFVTTRLDVPDNSSAGFSSIGTFFMRMIGKSSSVNNALSNMIVRVNAAPIDSLKINEVKCNKLSFDLKETIRYTDFDFTFNDNSSEYTIVSGKINPSTNRFANAGKYEVSGEINVEDKTTGDTRTLTFTCPDVLVLDKTIPDVIESTDNEFEDINPKVQAQVHKQGYNINDTSDLLYDYMPGATFSLFANVDIVDDAGNILYKQDQEICRKVTTEGAPLVFDDLPSRYYAVDKTVKYMYYIVETGLRNSDTHIISPTITSDEIVIDKTKDLGDSDHCPYIKYMITGNVDGIEDPVRVLPEILIKNITNDIDVKNYRIQKDWDDENDRDKIRPSKVYVALYCTNKPDELSVSYLKKDPYSDGYIYNGTGGGIIELSAQNNWRHRIDNVTNTYDITDLDTYKQWSSTEEGKDILKDMIEENGSSTFELYYEWREILYDKDNSPYQEEGFVINGNENTGYGQLYKTSTEGDENVTYVTNRHISDTDNIKVTKVWNDNNNEKGIRPESIDVILYRQVEGEGATELDRASLTASGGSSDLYGAQTESWTYRWTELPRKEGTKDIKYFVKEVMDESKYLTGESSIGYEASYDIADEMDDEKFFVTTITNTTKHKYGTYVSSKKITAANIDYSKGVPKFTFTLKGYDVYGHYHEYTHDFVFEKSYVDAHTDADGFVTMSYTFENIEYGNYQLTENGEEVSYELVEIK